jgi:hypothetical protein
VAIERDSTGFVVLEDAFGVAPLAANGEGAVALALNLLNGKQAQETGAGAPPVRSCDGALGGAPGNTNARTVAP